MTTPPNRPRLYAFSLGICLPTQNQGKGIQLNVAARRSDSGVLTKIKPVVRVAGTDYLKAEASLGLSYYAIPEMVELNPATSALWTKTDIDNAEFGVNLTSNPI